MESLDDPALSIERESIVLVPALEQLVRETPGGDRVEVRVSADAPPAIVTDALRLGQVLANLLTNALKYSDPAAPVSLEVRPADEGQRIRIAVIDHGIGMGSCERVRVFEPFYRPAVGARSADGAGLGLAIARRLVDAMGGTISTSPTRGGGTTFLVTLPVHAEAR
jgi:two-component system sensor histidine kinase KdpD